MVKGLHRKSVPYDSVTSWTKEMNLTEEYDTEGFRLCKKYRVDFSGRKEYLRGSS